MVAVQTVAYERPATVTREPSSVRWTFTRTLLDLVEIGLGVAVFPEAIAAPRGARLREIAISGRRWDWTVRAEALAPGPSNPAARALWTMLADQEQTLTGA